jgi:hypothetical protein
VNVNALGNDIVGDAANEPSLAVDPANHNRMVIGWRQFDNVASNFRQAGFGYTSNGGATWTTGKIEPGVFRSDPVLGIDGNGWFFYNSLTSTSTINSWLFRSTTGGASWGPSVFAYGGDKQWMAIDRSSQSFYQAWSIAGNSYFPSTFNKSIDDAASFTIPSLIPFAPIWGTLDVAVDRTLYVVGWATQADTFTGELRVARSTDAQNPVTTAPTFTTSAVDIGGFVTLGGPNPAGLLGQAWIAVDRSNGGRQGWVYVLSTVVTDDDPADIHFTRSTDNGQTWTPWVRVNDDTPGNRAFQWFGTMSVSPSGRIDAVWNDTRGSADSTISALRYSYSLDAGTTWSTNVQVTPTWNSTTGFPNQAKIGDYYQTVSDDTGVDVAYAATFNGGEDIYYLRIPNSAVPTGVGEPVAARTTALRAYPNPFAGLATIEFDAPAAGARARLEVFDVAGQRVTTLVDGFRVGPGQTVGWDGRDRDGSAVAPGVYWCRLDVGGAVQIRKLLRMR